MGFIRSNRRDIKAVITYTTIGMLAGFLYPLFTFGFVMPWWALRNGILIGFLIGSLASVFEVFLFQKRLQRLKFLYLLFVRSAFYLVIISISVMFVAAEGMSRLTGIKMTEVIYTEQYKVFLFGTEFINIVIYSVAVLFVVNFTRQMNQLLGQNVIINYITGKYHHPVEEERVFMFLDMTSSTSIAEKLGHYKYHTFLNEVFHEVTYPIVDSKGEIFQYVGDEIVITWKKKKAFSQQNCLKCFFRISRRLENQRQKFTDKYGFFPKFKAAVHGGKIIVGEVGLVKKELAFHGDVMNTTSRILSVCHPLQKELLISEDVMNNIKVNGYFDVEEIGKYKLRGKQQEVEIFSICEKGNSGRVKTETDLHS